MEKDNHIQSLISINTPIIDWDNCLKLANGKDELAKTILNMFVVSLPDTLDMINTHFEHKAFNLLADELHKLLGGCCYAGTPRLKLVTRTAETAVKEGDELLVSELIKLLNFEALKILNEYQQTEAYQL